MRIVGYTNPLTVAPDELVRVMVSSEAQSYRARLVRLMHGDINPAGPGFKAQEVESPFAGQYRGRHQAIYTGSWIEIPDHPIFASLRSFTFTFWMFPTLPGKPQTLLAKQSQRKTGLLISMDEEGRALLELQSDSDRLRLVTARPVATRAWTLVAAAYDQERSAATLTTVPRDWCDGPPQSVKANRQFSNLLATRLPLMIAARPAETPSTRAEHFNGKIGHLRLFDRPFDDAMLNRVSDERGQGQTRGVTGAWHFGTAVDSDRVVDLGPHGLEGRAFNAPMRGVTGPNWSNRHMHFVAAPDEYDAIYFNEDDLEDAGWEADFERRVPADLPSAIYAIHLTTDDAEDYVPLFVTPRLGQASSSVAFLAPVYSYLAYANEHYMANPKRQQLFGFDIEKALAGATEYERAIFDFVRETPLNSLYDAHADGSGVCYASRNRPLATVRPRYNKQSLWFHSPHQLNEDLCLVDWLMTKNHLFDVLTDERVHHAGVEVLAPYRVVMTGSHPEYWTEPMLNALQAYLAGGGRVMYLGGNGFYWVTSVAHDRPHLIEVRRHSGSRIWEAAPGEFHHSTTGEFGGPWRFRGRPPQRLVGVGFTGQGYDKSSPYRRLPASFDPRARFIFEGITSEVFGDYGLQLGGAGGYEIDRADPALGTPRHALRLAESFEHSDSYQHAVEEMFETDALQGGTINPLVHADMVFFEGPKGGAVFSVGSISWCGSLSANGYDNDVSQITQNVLVRFKSEQPFKLPFDGAIDNSADENEAGG